MPIWISDWLHNRKPIEDDRLILCRATYGDQVFASRVTKTGRYCAKLMPYTGELPPEHPDDIATDAGMDGRVIWTPRQARGQLMTDEIEKCHENSRHKPAPSADCR
jgi:hypothetical protein